MNRPLVVKEIVRATGRCMDEYSSNKELDRVNWFNASTGLTRQLV